MGWKVKEEGSKGENFEKRRIGEERSGKRVPRRGGWRRGGEREERE